MSLSREEEQIFAVKNVLTANVACRQRNRRTSNEIDEIELLNLAEELLNKLAEVFGKYN